MKKLLALVLALCMAAALCACGHDSAANTKPNEENTADKGTLTLAYWEENCPEWWEKVYADTGIKVEYEQIASADYANIMSTRVKGGEAPDIFFSRNEDLGKMYAENGFVEPMADMALVNDKVSAGVVDIMKTMFGETIYGIPVNVSYTGLLFYNQDIFDEVGVELPQNMDEFVAVCDKLVAAGYTPFINGASETNHIKHFSFCPFMINNLNGQQEWLKGLKDGTSSFMDEEWMTAMQYMQDGLKYSDPSSIGLTHVEAWAQFALSRRSAPRPVVFLSVCPSGRYARRCLRKVSNGSCLQFSSGKAFLSLRPSPRRASVLPAGSCHCMRQWCRCGSACLA